MEINECVMYVNFGDPRSRGREMKHKKHKNGDFRFENLLICLQLKNHLAYTTEICTQCG